MKRSSDERFEKELLQALREPIRAPERNAARTRVSLRLQATLSCLEVGAASTLPLMLEAPSIAASQSTASVAASSKALVGAAGIGNTAAAAGSGAAGAGAAVAATHPLGVLLTAFALGAGAGGGAFVVLSGGDVIEPGAAAASKAPAASFSVAPRQKSPSLPALPLPEQAHADSGAASELVEGSVRAEEPERARTHARGAGAPALASGSAQLGASVSPATGPSVDTLTVQQALLDRARAALARGDGAQALAALAEHARVHPASTLAEEREALTIKSLIASGDYPSARARGDRFGQRYPHSLFLPSIRAALSKNP